MLRHIERLEKLIHKESSWFLARELDLENYLITITEVTIDKNLNKAVVFVGIFPEKKQKEGLVELAQKRNELQSYLFKKIKTWKMPQIEFEIDKGAENAARVESAFLKK